MSFFPQSVFSSDIQFCINETSTVGVVETANVVLKVAETQLFLLAIYEMTSTVVLMANLDCKLNLLKLGTLFKGVYIYGGENAGQNTRLPHHSVIIK